MIDQSDLPVEDLLKTLRIVYVFLWNVDASLDHPIVSKVSLDNMDFNFTEIISRTSSLTVFAVIAAARSRIFPKNCVLQFLAL